MASRLDLATGEAGAVRRERERGGGRREKREGGKRKRKKERERWVKETVVRGEPTYREQQGYKENE